MQASSAAGFSNEDIAAGLAKYGVDPGQAIQAYQESRPDMFMQSSEIMDNVNSGNLGMNAADPQYQAYTGMNDYTRSLFGELQQPAVGGGVAAPSPVTGGGTALPHPLRPGDHGYQAPGGPQHSTGGVAYAPPGGGFGGGGGPNPYLPWMADDIQRRSGEALGKGLQNIRGNFVGAGGLGGSRQGVAEAGAISGANDNLVGQLTGMFGNAWDANQGRAVQRYGMDLQHNLGLGGQALTNQAQHMNFWGQERTGDRADTALGAQLYGLGTQGAWSPLNSASDLYRPYTGLNSSQTTGGQSGGGWAGALGGALGAAQLGRNMGWFGSGTSGGSTGGSAITGAGSPYDYTGQFWY